MDERSKDDSEPGGSRACVDRVGIAPVRAGVLRNAHALREVVVDIVDDERLLKAPSFSQLSEWARKAVALACGSTGGEVRVKLVDDAAMSAAHLRYSGIAGTTDVLTFDLSEGQSSRGGPMDVDILICVDEAARQAQRRGFMVEREIVLYIVHGVLHCLGHDDHDDVRFAAMHAEEDRILSVLGLGPTFSVEPMQPEAACGVPDAADAPAPTPAFGRGGRGGGGS